MAKILSQRETDELNSTIPSKKAADEIRAALDNLTATIEKHGCVAFIETICGEICVHTEPKGKTIVVRDREEKPPAGAGYCRGLYLSTGFNTFDGEHENIYKV